MIWTKRLWLAIAFLACGAPAALAQQPIPRNVPPVSGPYNPSNVQDYSIPSVGGGPGSNGFGGSAPGNGLGSSNAASNGNGAAQPFDPVGGNEPAQEEPKPGPTPIKDVGLITDTLGLRNIFGDSGLFIYGWLDGGYTYANTGRGLLSVEPRENRFGNELLANQLAIAVEKTLSTKDWDVGFKAIYFAGADAALLHPLGGFEVNDPRFGHDFRDLYVSLHAPILTEGGVDLKVGRMTTPVGYTGALAPYRTYYSNDYQWFYSEDGAWTGALATVHVNKQMDVLGGVTLGANTFFRTRANGSYCGIGQINYWLTEEKKTLVSASFQGGRQAIFPASATADGNDYVATLTIFHTWSKYFDQVVQGTLGYRDTNGVETGEFYGLYTIGMLHLSKCLDLNVRAEWFNDVSGLRTGFRNNYEEATIGFNYHPVKYLEIRPEIRGDFANDTPAFRAGDNGFRRNQLTAAIECLIKF